MTQRTVKSAPNSLKNLVVFTKENAGEFQKKSVLSRMINKEIREEFKLNAKNFVAVMEELPEISALAVLRLAMHTALQKDNYEDAARYAAMVAEYEAPKLARTETVTTRKIQDMTEEELQAMIAAEGLKSPSSE